MSADTVAQAAEVTEVFIRPSQGSCVSIFNRVMIMFFLPSLDFWVPHASLPLSSHYFSLPFIPLIPGKQKYPRTH